MFNETVLRELKHRSRKIGCGRQAFYPKMDNKLYQVFLEIRNNDVKIKGGWIRQTTQKIINELHPNADFRMLNRFSRTEPKSHFTLQDWQTS